MTASTLTPASSKNRASAPNDYIELKRRIKAAGLLEPQSGYYWLKSRDMSGNLSVFSSGVNATAS